MTEHAENGAASPPILGEDHDMVQSPVDIPQDLLLVIFIHGQVQYFLLRSVVAAAYPRVLQLQGNRLDICDIPREDATCTLGNNRQRSRGERYLPCIRGAL